MDLLILLLTVFPTMSAPVGNIEVLVHNHSDKDREPRWNFNYAPGQNVINIDTVNGGDFQIGHEADIEINIGDSSSELQAPGETVPVDCEWSEYTDWSLCSVSCGDGYRRRDRKVMTSAKYGGNPCVGENVETERCNTGSCTEAATNDESGQDDQNEDAQRDGSNSAKQACTGPPHDPTSGSWKCNDDLTICELICTSGYAPVMENIECVNGQWGVTSSHICSPYLYLLAGGEGGSKNVELYHPTLGSTSCKSPPELTQDWEGHTIFIHDSTIYLCGGYYAESICQSLDTSIASSWTTHTLPSPIGSGLSSVVLGDKVVFLGGSDLPATYTTLPLSISPTLTPVPNLSYKGEGQCVAKLSETSFIISGGSYYNEDVFGFQFLSTVLLYNLETESVTSLASLSPPRSQHGCITVQQEGKMWLIVTGGVRDSVSEFESNSETLSTTQRLDIETNTWEDWGDLKQARYDHAMINSESKGVMVLGGFDDITDETLNSVEVLKMKEWQSIEPSLLTPRSSFGVAVKVSADLFPCQLEQRGSWEVIEWDDCWEKCGQKSGKCSWCGSDGYCCRKGHGGCPDVAEDVSQDKHRCVREKGGSNGELVCEGHNFGKERCESIGCCHYDDGQCWSSVGPGSCGLSGVQVCEGHNFGKERCESIGCCHYDDGQCWSSVGTGSCVRRSDSTCKCGVTNPGSNRIVGGSEAEVNEYPWTVLLSMGCGGSVIGDRWILTAAHCFFRNGQQVITDPSAVTITLGEHDRSQTTESEFTKEVIPDQIIIHEFYDPFNYNINDLALLRLPSAIDLTVYTPVCLPPQGEDYTNKNVWVYGWGSLSEGGSTAEILQELRVTVLADSAAPSMLGLTNDHLDVMVLAGGEEGRDSCQGDSGGPLSFDNKGQHQLVGATSWGIGCARAGFPGVYTEISALRNWIDDKIGDANTCSIIF